MSLAELRKRTQRTWTAIAKAEAEAERQLARIRTLVSDTARTEGAIDSEDISVVVFGSLARGEWTSGSDLDWTLLIDGQADHHHAETAHRMARILKEADFGDPGRTGMFGNLTFSHSLIHQIGGQDDTNRNTTQRLLLLLESRVANRKDAHQRVVRGIVLRYLENDFRAFRPKVPRFLLNDVHRFWRTMCVDYASKYRERAAEGWAIRNVKLRMSRKLLFAAGLLTCFSCDPAWLRHENAALYAEPTVEGMAQHLESFASRAPLDILAGVLLQPGKEETATNLLDTYDYFLAQLDNQTVRDHLTKLRPEEAEKDERYREIQDRCANFEKGLEQLFFEDNSDLIQLTRKYGVF